MCVCLRPSGFRLKHFLRDDETLSEFLLKNMSFPEHSVQEIREAEVDLEKVRGRSQEGGAGSTLNMLSLNCAPCCPGPPPRVCGPPEGHVSQQGTAAAAGLCDHLRSSGVGAGTGSDL